MSSLVIHMCNEQLALMWARLSPLRTLLCKQPDSRSRDDHGFFTAAASVGSPQVHSWFSVLSGLSYPYLLPMRWPPADLVRP